jgi:hypothetical protein
MKQLIENSTLTKKYLKKLYKRVLKFALAEDFYTGGLVVGKVYIGKLCFDIMIESTYSDIYTARGRGLTARLYVQLYAGGIDTGYGYTSTLYPYDYVDEADIDMSEVYTKKKFKKRLIGCIEGLIGCGKVYLNTDLKELAEEEVEEW